ncbi:hypothetical protein F5Y16DRAFT_389566 [Xylariaceae sp. FL0255]|nr:hypothetical protein F5Y16DRAFT_389566 [Xylariaceae sp. FL0255]
MAQKALVFAALLQNVLGGLAPVQRREVVTLTQAPMVTQVVPAFTELQTTITSAGYYTVGIGGDCGLLSLGCVVSVVDAVVSEVLTLTGILEETTTYPCSTPTTWTSYSTTYEWSPPPTSGYSSCPVTTATATTTTTVTTTTTTTLAPTCTSTPALTCDKYGYLIQESTLFQVDLSTGNYTTVKKDISNGQGFTYNAMGYNILDNYLYSLQIDKGAYSLARIDETGGVETLAKLSAGGIMGDIDGSGTFWYSDGSSTWNSFDVNPNSPTYLQPKDSGTFSGLDGYAFADWVYLPSQGENLWTVSHNTTHVGLWRYTPASNTWFQITTYSGLTIADAGFGAMYGIDNGTVYASNNANGYIYGFPVDGSSYHFASYGPKSAANDGARCASNLNV